MTCWTITLEEADDGSGDLVMPLPPDLLESAGWKEGDVLDWTDNKNGTWSLTKKDEHSKYYYDTDRNK
jgi:hypothetical protein